MINLVYHCISMCCGIYWIYLIIIIKTIIYTDTIDNIPYTAQITAQPAIYTVYVRIDLT